jgi:hypothetical protein
MIQKTWTVMMYLAGDNDLSGDLSAIVREMLEAAPSPHVKILALVDTREAAPLLYRLTDDEIIVETQPEDTGFAALGALLAEGKALTDDDEHSALILFGHGPAIGSNGFLRDSHPAGYLSLKQLAELITKKFGRAIDVLGLDSCMMCEAEIAYELRGCADHLVGSEGMARVDAWPFREFLEHLANPNEATDPASVAAQLYQSYGTRNQRFYDIEDRSSDQVHCRLPQVAAALDDTVRPLVALLLGKLPGLDTGDHTALALKQALLLARLEAQSYWNETFADLADFCDLLAAKCELLGKLSGGGVDLSDVSAASRAVGAAVDGAVARQSYIGPALQYSRGLSVYFPWTMPLGMAGPPDVELEDEWGEKTVRRISLKRRTMFEAYLENAFAQAAGVNWGEFLYAFFAATLRDMRGLPDADKLNYSACKAQLKTISGRTISLIPTDGDDKDPELEGGGGKVHPTLGRVHPELGRVHPTLGRVHPELGRVHPTLGRVHPELGLRGGQAGNVKNSPRASYPFHQLGLQKSKGWIPRKP